MYEYIKNEKPILLVDTVASFFFFNNNTIIYYGSAETLAHNHVCVSYTCILV